eukprot:gene6924-12539_t
MSHIGKAVKENPGYLKLRKIRAAQRVAHVISQSNNKVYLNAGQLMLNIQDTEDIDKALGNMVTIEERRKKK